MSPEEATAKIQGACNEISLLMMKIHPAIPHLQNEEVQGICIKAAHQLTVELEILKKQMIQLQKRDDSTDL
ncbi:MAG: hypothetical protein AAF191_10085 [Verrucomicrobiota bacterium]